MIVLLILQSQKKSFTINWDIIFFGFQSNNLNNNCLETTFFEEGIYVPVHRWVKCLFFLWHINFRVLFSAKVILVEEQ